MLWEEKVDPSFQQRIEELVKVSKKADKEDKELIEALQVLVRRPEWQTYLSLINKRIQGFSDIVLMPAQTMDGAVALEYAKGAMFGLILASTLPGVIVENAMKPSGDDGDEE